MTDNERLEKQVAFCLEIDKEKQIGRQTYLSDGKRKENDAEHAWHMAIMTLILQEYANEEIDTLRTMSMLLIHDLVEIYAGDTYAYDEEAKKTQKEREQKAADRLFQILPKDQEIYIRKLWEEFEAQQTPEAKFARTLDNFQPVMLNAASGGKAWKEHGAKLSQIMKRNKVTKEGSGQLWRYAFEEFIAPNIKNGRIDNSGGNAMELWDIYDENKKKTGRTMVRNDWNMKEGDFHLTVLGVIQRPDGKFLITKRVETKSWAPGWWEVSGGACQAGEESSEAIVREIKEETGLDVSNAKGGLFYTYKRVNPGEKDNYFVDVYRFVMDFSEEDLVLQEGETDGYKIATLEEIQQIAEKGIFLHYDSIKNVFLGENQ